MLEETKFSSLHGDPNLLQLLSDTNPTLVFVKDRQGRFVFANKALAEVYGVTSQDLLGKTDADFNPNIAEIEHFLADDLHVMDTQTDLHIPEEQVTAPTGEVVWLQTIKRPLIEDDGQCNHILGVSLDITARITAERRETSLRSRLARYERMDSLGIMAGGIAHDLNNILAPVVAYPALIRERIDDGMTLELVDEMEQSASRAVEVISKLLTMARRGIYRAEPISAEAAIQSFLSSAELKKIATNDNEIELITELETPLPYILGSESHLFQVLLNITKNAFESIDGKGQVKIAARKHSNGGLHINTMDAATEEDHVLIEISDTGSGISEQDMSRIFDPFFTRKQDAGAGTGLGLSIAYGMVEDMSGIIDVTSATEDGSCFRVWLPATKEAPNRFEETYADCRGSETILLVDDLHSQRQLGGRLLGALGYRVVTAATPDEAMMQLAQVEVSLVIIDMILGDGADGVDVYRKVNREYPLLPCIMVSGYSENERVRTGLKEGIKNFVRKPYTQMTLGTAVRNTLDQLDGAN